MTEETPSPSSLSPKDDELKSPSTIEGPSPLGESFDELDLADQDHATMPPSRARRGASRRKLPSRPMGLIKKVLLALALFFCLYSLTGFFACPLLLTRTLPAQLSKKLNRPVTIGSASFNPYNLRVTLKNGIIGRDLGKTEDPVDPIFSFGRLEAKIRPLALFKKGPAIRSMRGNSVFIHLVRQTEGNFNITPLLQGIMGSSTGLGIGQITSLFNQGDVNLTDSRLIYEDTSTGTRHEVDSISFTLPARDKDGLAIAPHFSAIVNGSQVSIGGQSHSSEAGQSIRLTLTLEQINISDYLRYLPGPLAALLTKGEADMELLLDYQLNADNSSTLEIKGTGEARDIWLQSPTQADNKIASASFSLTYLPLLAKVEINKLILNEPEIQLHKNKDGSYLFPGVDTDASRPGEISLATLVVKNGRLSYIDQQIEGGFGVIFNKINLSMDRSASEPSLHAYALNCVSSRKTRIASQGSLVFGKGDLNGLLILHNLPMTALTSYLSAETGIAISSGIIDKAEAKLTLSFKPLAKASLSLRSIKGTASNMELSLQGKPWLQAQHCEFSDALLDSAPTAFSLGTLKASGLLAHISKNHSPLLTKIFPVQPQQPAMVTDVELTKSSAIFHDFPFQKMAEVPVTINNLQAHGLGGGSKKPGHIEASLSLPPKGRCTLRGQLTAAPLTGHLEVEMSEVPMSLFTFADLAWFRPSITAGSLDFNGTFNLAELQLNGQTHLHNVIGIDPDDGLKLIDLEQATIPKLDLHLSPAQLSIDELALANLQLYATLAPQASSFAERFISGAGRHEMAKSNLQVQQITIKDSTLHFSDQSLTPAFSQTMSGISGTLQGLENKRGSTLHFQLAGKNNKQTSLTSQGEVSLFDESFTANFNVNLRDQHLEPLISYLEPMVGYSLKGGMFDMDISYREVAGLVQADTLLTVRKLSLGNTDLGNKQFPVAVALVTDTDDLIRLELEISGDMSDPSYTFHSAYGKQLRNLLSKATVSPFSLLTNFYDPESTNIDHILFAPGSSEPDESCLSALDALRDILHARPLLSLTLKGYSSGSEDRQALLDIKKEEEEKRRLAYQNRQSSDLITSYGKEEIAPPASPLSAEGAAILTVSKEELAALALERCQRLKEILTQEYGLPESRIIISPNTTVVPESGVGLAGTRADIIVGRLP